MMCKSCEVYVKKRTEEELKLQRKQTSACREGEEETVRSSRNYKAQVFPVGTDDPLTLI